MTSKFPEFVSLHPQHRLRVVADRPPLSPLVWAMDHVVASPRRDSPEYDTLLAETFGSSADWGDEFLFDTAGRRLRSLILTVPEREGDSAELNLWKNAPSIAGSISPEREEAYGIDTMDARVLSSDGRILLCPLHHGAVSSPWRLALADDLNLLFDGEGYLGWMLTNALAHFGPWATHALEAALAEPDTAFIDAVHELHRLVLPDSLNALFESEPSITERLQRLSSLVRTLPRCPRQETLLEKIENLQELASEMQNVRSQQPTDKS